MKKWKILHANDHSISLQEKKNVNEAIIHVLLENRGLKTAKDQKDFLEPKNPFTLTPKDVGINKKALQKAIQRIHDAIEKKESIVVYADYDADGVTAGAIMWEALYVLGARVMPYIPHRADEGYGFSEKGIEYIIEAYDPTLVISVDHGITAASHVALMRERGIDVIVTDHHVKPKKVPTCITVHTTDLSGAGISWFVAKTLLKGKKENAAEDLLPLATIGTIADMVPLLSANRSIVKAGIVEMKKTKRVGLVALMSESGLQQKDMTSYDVSHVLAPRINAMGRLEHALDALRLLCTTKEDRAKELAMKLGSTNKERQQITVDTAFHAKDEVGKIYGETITDKILVIGHESYNQGIIGLVAGKIVETYWRPTIVIAKGETISKASARSIPGFNIVEAIRSLNDILIDVGGHPMAAGFTIETIHIAEFTKRIGELGREQISESMLVKTLLIDMEISLDVVTFDLWKYILRLEPYGLGNSPPLFLTKHVKVVDLRVVGNGNKHLKLRVTTGDKTNNIFDAIAFGMGDLIGSINNGDYIDIAYSVDLNEWNGSKKLQLKIKDIIF